MDNHVTGQEMLRVKSWREHQHYKNKGGSPVWIKLYRKILTDYTFRSLSEADRFKLIGVWLLASETEGVIPRDPRYVADCIGVKRVDLDLFVARGFLEVVYTDSRVGLDGVGESGLAPKEKKEKKEKTLTSDVGPTSEKPIAHATEQKHFNEPARFDFAAEVARIRAASEERRKASAA